MSANNTLYNIEAWPNLAENASLDSTIEQKVADKLAGMTLTQKVAQMIQPEIRSVTPEQMQQYCFGSYLNGGGSFPHGKKDAEPSDWLELANDYFVASIESECGIPTMWGTDAVHGHNNVKGATIFPHNIGLGAANNAELMHDIANATAKEVRTTGIDWIFAPTIAVAVDNRWGRTYESYSEHSDIVCNYAPALVEGIQTGHNEAGHEPMMLACAKHFIGDGGTDLGRDQGDTLCDEATLFEVHGRAYVEAINAGVQTIMASFNSWKGDKLHGHHYLLTRVLKERLGFDGFVVGDWNGHAQVPGCSADSCAAVINAGVDIIMVPEFWPGLLKNTMEQVQSGEISVSRIDDAVTRILRVKYRMGLMDSKPPKARTPFEQTNWVGHTSHRELARQAVRESLVLLKNNHDVLPISANKRVLVVGDAAKDIGQQCGGWSVTWQGTGNVASDFPKATSIYDGIESTMLANGGAVEFSQDGKFETKPDVAIVVFGEQPYAEGVGDIDHLEYDFRQKTDLKRLQTLQQQGIPVVSVFLTGRPLWVNKEINASDAFVVAWLPGSEGVGVADVLLADEHGKTQFDFCGQLPFSWPRSDSQLLLNVNDEDYDPLFPYGFGLSYQTEAQELGQLPESNDMPYPVPNNDLVLYNRVVGDSMQIQLEDNESNELVNSQTHTFKSAIHLQTLDWQVQEDALSIRWLDDQPARFVIAGHARNLESFSANDAELQFMVKSVEKPKTDVFITMTTQSGEESAPVNIAQMLNGAGDWIEIAIPLKQMNKSGFHWNEVTNKFIMGTTGKLELGLANVRIATPS